MYNSPVSKLQLPRKYRPSAMLCRESLSSPATRFYKRVFGHSIASYYQIYIKTRTMGRTKIKSQLQKLPLYIKIPIIITWKTFPFHPPLHTKITYLYQNFWPQKLKPMRSKPLKDLKSFEQRYKEPPILSQSPWGGVTILLKKLEKGQ